MTASAVSSPTTKEKMFEREKKMCRAFWLTKISKELILLMKLLTKKEYFCKS